MKVFSFTMALFIAAGSGLVSTPRAACADDSVNCTMPAGWTPLKAKGALMAAASPDQTMQVVVFKFPAGKLKTALEIAQNQMGKLSHTKVITAPADMSKHREKFNADSVAKMALARTRDDGAAIFYRAFVFVKGSSVVVIEAYSTAKADKATFTASDSVIESFRFK